MGQLLCASGALESALQRAGGQLPFVVEIERVQRNAGAAQPSTQTALRERVRSLVRTLGYRPDYQHEDVPPWQVPWTPLAVASDVVRWLVGEAQRWLKNGSIYDYAKQPAFINNHVQQLADAAGRRTAEMFFPVAANYESAPPAVINKAPSQFPASLMPGVPLAPVLKAEPSWRFWYSAQALAIHFDVLAGVPTKLQIFEESLGEAVMELPETLAGAARAVGGTVEKLVGAAIPWTPILIAGGIVAAALVVPRLIGGGAGR
jgi:hypothetical protein